MDVSLAVVAVTCARGSFVSVGGWIDCNEATLVLFVDVSLKSVFCHLQEAGCHLLVESYLCLSRRVSITHLLRGVLLARCSTLKSISDNSRLH